MCKKAVKAITSPFSGGRDKPKAPEPVAIEARPAAAPAQDAESSVAREDERRRRAAAAGLASTILTGQGGLGGQASSGKKTLLGA